MAVLGLPWLYPLQAATGLQQLLAFRHDCTTVTTPAEQAAATAGLTSAAAGLGTARRSPARAHRAGRDDRTVRPYRQDGSQLSPARGNLLGRIYGARVRAEPDPGRAMAVIEVAETRMNGLPVCQPCSIGFYLAASIAASRGSDLARAREYLLTGEGVSARWSGGGWHAAVLESRAELAAAERRADDAPRLFEQAASGFDRAGQPLDARRCRVAGGS